MKAYLPNLITKKDSKLITPKHSQQMQSPADRNGQIAPSTAMVMKVYTRSGGANSMNRDSKPQKRLLKEQDFNGEIYIPDNY